MDATRDVPDALADGAASGLPVDLFTDYPLHPVSLAALDERGITSPTPIQLAAIPALLAGRDVVGQARTGSGKTLAFGLPLLEAISPERLTVQALVLAPTRELASQVATVISEFGAGRGINVALVYGGTSPAPQRAALRRGAQVAVGTPGRILDLVNQGVLWLDQARFVILDEADEMFDQGFAQDVERIMDKTSNSRQTALFSATMPDWVQRTAARYLYEPETISIDPGAVPEDAVPHVAYLVPDARGGRRPAIGGYGRGRDEADYQAKLAALRDLLDHRGSGLIIVFGRTKQGVAALARQLDREGYRVGALQGNMSQSERDYVMDAFRSRRIDTLVATNVAARGLDLVGVDLVVNFELPESAELLTHRVGRTGRMGRGGQAITLLGQGNQMNWNVLTSDLPTPMPMQPWPGAHVALGPAGAATPVSDDLTIIAPISDQSPSDDARAAVMTEPEEDQAMTDVRRDRSNAGDDRRRGGPDRAETPATTGQHGKGEAAASSGPGGSADDLIARALANAAATPAPAESSPPTFARPAERAAMPRPSDAIRADTPTERPSASVASAPAPAPAPMTEKHGTPRPPWLWDAADRVRRWSVGTPAAGQASVAPEPVRATPPRPAPRSSPDTPAPTNIATQPETTLPVLPTEGAVPPVAARTDDASVGPNAGIPESVALIAGQDQTTGEPGTSPAERPASEDAAVAAPRRRTRARSTRTPAIDADTSAASITETAASSQAQGEAEAAPDDAGASATPEAPAAKPVRRTRQRRTTAADAPAAEGAPAVTTPAVPGEPRSETVASERAAATAEPDATAEPARRASRSSRRSRPAAQDTTTASSNEAGGTDGAATAPHTGQAPDTAETEPTQPPRQRSRRSSDGRSVESQAADERSSQNRDSGGRGGTRGSASRRDPAPEPGNRASDPPATGNTGRSQSAASRTSTTSTRGNAASSGRTGGRATGGRRQTAAVSTRCAACGTPLPKGSTGKYCATCAQELRQRNEHDA